MPAIAMLSLFLISSATHAQALPTISTGTVSLQQVLELVRRDNPEILAAHKRWEAAEKHILQAATLDKPRLDLERMYVPTGNNAVPDTERAISVTQDVPFPTKLYYRHGLAAKDAEISEQAYRAKLNGIIARARTAYASLFLAERSLSIFDENIDVMRRFARVAESKVAAGRSHPSDALKAQVELTRMLNMQVALEGEKETSQATLNALMGRDASAMLATAKEPVTAALSARFEDLESTALSERPELREASLASQRAGSSLSLARSDYLPDLMLQYRRRHDPQRGGTYDAILGLSLPLWFWKPAAMVAEAQASRQAAQAELQAETLATRADVRTAWARARTAGRLLEAYRTALLPQAEESLKIAESGYRADKSSFLDLLDAQRSLLNYQLEYYQNMAAYEQRAADLARVVGREL